MARRREWTEHALDAAADAMGPTRRATVGEVFPPRIALARGRGGMIVTALAVAAFAGLFAAVRSRRSVGLDLRATLAIQRHRARWFGRAMHAASWPGFPPQSRLIPPSLALAWLLLGFPIEALFQALAWGASGVSFSVKQVMRRPRPDHPEIRVAIARIGGSSFPSGHVLNYVSVYGFLAFLLASLLRPALLRRALVGGLALLLALVGPSRIYLGHHWATDVTASYLLGTSYLLTLTALYRRVKVWLLPR